MGLRKCIFPLETTNFRKYASVYNLFNQGKDYAGEAAYVSRIIRSYGRPGSTSILDLGSGTGAHAAELAKGGYTVRGIERSPDMAAIAMERGVDTVVGDICHTTVPGPFDAVVSLFHVISYITEDEELASCFRHSYDHLSDGGLFMFDSWYTPAVRAQQPEKRERSVRSEGFSISRVAHPELHPGRNIVDVHYEFTVQSEDTGLVDQWHECHPMRHFTTSEIETLAHRSGFQLLKAEEFLTGAPPSDHTWGVCYILKK